MIFKLKAWSRKGVLSECLAAVLGLLLTVALCLASPTFAGAEESEDKSSEAKEAMGEKKGQDRESMAMDSTATQWSFQFAYQVMPDYHDDILDQSV